MTSSDRSRAPEEMLSIGAVADRTGLATSAIRFYEAEGLVQSDRTSSGHRRFARSVIRRLSFIQICQRLGYSLEAIRTQLSTLPADRAPTEQEWSAMAQSFRGDLDDRINQLERLRDSLDGCIGCGCLSLQRCAIWNHNDTAASLGPGPRWLLGDRPQPDTA